MRTKQDFEEIKAQISVETIADHLLEKDGRLYKFPSERTASLRIYPATQSFYDFGRATGGDAVRLWSHVKGCDSWTALNEMTLKDYSIYRTTCCSRNTKKIQQQRRNDDELQKRNS